MRYEKSIRMKVFLFLAFLSCIFLLTAGLFASEVKKDIAVLPFKANNIDVDMDDDDASHAVTRMVTDALVKSGKVTVVEYNEVLKAMEKLDIKGFPDDKEEQDKLAKELGVKAFVIGWIENIEIKKDEKKISDWWDGDKDIEVNRLSAIVDLRANLIDASTLTLQAFLEGRGRENKYGVNLEDFNIGSSEFNETIVGIAIQSAVTELTDGILEKTGKTAYSTDVNKDVPEGFVAYVDKEEVIINIGSDAGVKVGDIFNVVKRIDVTDPVTGNVIKVKERLIGEINVVQVEAKSATGKAMNLQDGYSIQVKDMVN